MAGPEFALRLLFDEGLPWRVAAELRGKGYDVSWVGDQAANAPDRSAPDPKVLRFAAEQGRTVVTTDRGLVLACTERNQSVIWITPYGQHRKKQLDRAEKRKLILREVSRWAKLCAGSTGPMCILVSSTRSDPMSLDQATRLLQRRKRQRTLRQRGSAPDKRNRGDQPRLPVDCV